MIEQLRACGIITADNKINSNIRKMLKTRPEIENLIYSNTDFIPKSRPYELLERMHCIIHSIANIPICSVCGVESCLFIRHQRTYSVYCSNECKYKCPQRLKNIRRTMRDRHGVDHALQSPALHAKFSETMRDKFGVNAAMQSKKLRDLQVESVTSRSNDVKAESVRRRKSTMDDRYGVEHALQSDTFKRKGRETSITRFGRTHGSQSHISNSDYVKLNDREWLHDMHITNGVPFTLIAEQLHVDGKTVKSRMIELGIPINLANGTSHGESELYNFVQSLLPNLDVIRNTRDIIAPYEIDVYIPDHKLAIEYCGLYWHCSLYKESNYHAMKHDMCASKGIQLLTIFEDEWLTKSHIVKELIKSKLNLNSDSIYARRTAIRDISNNECSAMLDSIHIQGNGSGKLKYGLFHCDELIGAAVFKNRGKGVYELVRYASRIRVVGGLSKVITHLTRQVNARSIVTFSDNRISNGGMYHATGFEETADIRPDYMYILDGERHHKFNFRHTNLKQMLPNYDREKSESILTSEYGINRIYDCGKKRFELCLE